MSLLETYLISAVRAEREIDIHRNMATRALNAINFPDLHL